MKTTIPSATRTMLTTRTTMMMKTTTRMITHLFVFLLSVVMMSVDCAMTLKPTLDRTSLNITTIEGKKAILPCKVHDLGSHKVKVIACEGLCPGVVSTHNSPKLSLSRDFYLNKTNGPGKGWKAFATTGSPETEILIKVVWSDQWNTVLTFNAQRVIDDPRISVFRPHDEEWNLQFGKVKYGDQGVYECQVNTNPPLKQSVMLIVVVPPTITTERDLVTVREGQTANLTCKASGTPRPTVTWHRQPGLNDLDTSGSTSSESCATSRLGKTGEILLIHNVSRYCGGKYNCVADNGITPKDQKTITVKVEFHPEVNLINERMGQALGKDTILECTVSGFPQPHTIWTHQGRQIPINMNKYRIDIFDHQDDLDTVSYSLNIKNLTMEDYGIYACVGSNDRGQDSDDIVLYQYVAETQPPPQTTTTTTTTTTTLARHIYPHPNSRPITNTKKNFYKGNRRPSGRLGIGNRGGSSRDRTELIDTEYGSRTRPAEASIRAGENNGYRHNPSIVLSTVIALCLLLALRC